MNKIYFAGSIRGGREDVDIYLEIVEHLKVYGDVLTEHVADKGLTLLGENNPSDRRIHDRDVNWLGEANVIVAEVSRASLGVGYEIGRMVERNLQVPKSQRKHILCLFRSQTGKKLSAMITGSSGLKNVEYRNLEEAKKEIDVFFDLIKQKSHEPDDEEKNDEDH
jgi:2'-deoxynucleoside 5'-phosphate N-hydrolase